MKVTILKINTIFFVISFFIWAQIMFLIHGGYTYFKSPLPSKVRSKSVQSIINRQNIIRNTIEELQKSLLSKKESSVERGHILHNIGLLYYDLFKITHKNLMLDSSEYYYSNAINIISDNTRFYYNLGRLYMESKKPDSAKKYYEKSLEIKPDNILALHNLALINFYEYNDIYTAKSLLEKVLNINPESPVCNYVLGDIYNKNKDYINAVLHFNREIKLIYRYYNNKKRFSIPAYAINLAILRSHYYLFTLYSTTLKNKEQAKKNLHAYLAIEKNDELKTDAVNKYRRYWHEKYNESFSH